MPVDLVTGLAFVSSVPVDRISLEQPDQVLVAGTGSITN
jgi:hypothetical protein